MPPVETEPRLPARKRLRLREFDYRQPGIYFVTICSTERRCWFGEVVDGNVALSKVGELVRDAWCRMAERHTGIAIDDFVIMPNHLHGLIGLSTVTTSLAEIVGGFKSISVRMARRAGLLHGATLWQRGFHDHVVRDDADLDRVREYIQNNPLKWHLDRENPNRIDERSQRAGASPAPTS
jgi:REP element-mobilizing transposase RayT